VIECGCALAFGVDLSRQKLGSDAREEKFVVYGELDRGTTDSA